MFERLREAGKLDVPDPDSSLAFGRDAGIDEPGGLPAYESPTTRARRESRHNLIYWRYGEYAGIGPGAHGRISRRGAARAGLRTRSRHVAAAGRDDGHGLVEIPRLSLEEQGDEFLLMGLRLARASSRAGTPSSARSIRLYRSLIEDEFIERDDRGRIRVTPMGAPLLDTVVADVAA